MTQMSDYLVRAHNAAQRHELDLAERLRDNLKAAGAADEVPRVAALVEAARDVGRGEILLEEHGPTRHNR